MSEMKRYVNGYIISELDIIDIDLWRRRLRADRLYYENKLRILTERKETIKEKLRLLNEGQTNINASI